MLKMSKLTQSIAGNACFLYSNSILKSFPIYCQKATVGGQAKFLEIK